MIHFLLWLFLIGATNLLVLYIADKIVTARNLATNQKEWDEFSKGMTYREKMNCLVDWLEHQRAKNGWRHYYIPNINNKED